MKLAFFFLLNFLKIYRSQEEHWGIYNVNTLYSIACLARFLKKNLRCNILVSFYTRTSLYRNVNVNVMHEENVCCYKIKNI